MTAADRQLEQFLAGEPVPIDALLRSLPRGANPALIVRAVLRMLVEPHWLAAIGKPPVHVIRAVIEAPAGQPAHLFLKLAIAADLAAAAMKQAWAAATDALRELANTRSPLGTDARTAELASLAKQPVVLHAIQGVAANSAEVPLAMLIVLAIDASDASIDALIPHLDVALGQRDARLERLAQIRPYIKPTPALAALFTELDGAVDARRSTSPALAFARSLGIAVTDVFWCSFLIRSTATHNTIPEVQGSVRIDSREDRWFAVEVTRLAPGPDRTNDRSTTFDPLVDQLEISRCDPAELPAWLRRTATRLKIKWDRFFVRTSADAKVIENWLIVT